MQGCADPEDIVIGPDDPEAARILQHPVGLFEPAVGEAVIGGEIVEFVPAVFDPIDPCVVGPLQVAAELEIIGRIREYQIDRAGGKFGQLFDRVAANNPVWF